MSKNHDAITKGFATTWEAAAALMLKPGAVSATVTASNNKIVASGPHGVFTCRADQPSEIGIAVTHALTGMTPPPAYRRRATDKMGDEAENDLPALRPPVVELANLSGEGVTATQVRAAQEGLRKAVVLASIKTDSECGAISGPGIEWLTAFIHKLSEELK